MEAFIIKNIKEMFLDYPGMSIRDVEFDDSIINAMEHNSVEIVLNRCPLADYNTLCRFLVMDNFNETKDGSWKKYIEIISDEMDDVLLTIFVTGSVS